MDTCRDKQTEPKARLEACEKVIAAGQATGKDLGIAYARRAADALMNKRDYDKAIAALQRGP